MPFQRMSVIPRHSLKEHCISPSSSIQFLGDGWGVIPDTISSDRSLRFFVWDWIRGYDFIIMFERLLKVNTCESECVF